MRAQGWTVNADIRIPNSRFDLQLWTQRCGRANLCNNRVMLRRSGAGERERNRVLCRIALVHTSSAVGCTRRRPVVVMDGKPMVVLRMIVIRVGVGVQHKRRARRRDQRRDEQQCQDAVHTEECMQRGHIGQNDESGAASYSHSLIGPKRKCKCHPPGGAPTPEGLTFGVRPLLSSRHRFFRRFQISLTTRRGAAIGTVPAFHAMATCPPTRSCSTAGAGVLFGGTTGAAIGAFTGWVISKVVK